MFDMCLHSLKKKKKKACREIIQLFEDVKGNTLIVKVNHPLPVRLWLQLDAASCLGAADWFRKLHLMNIHERHS